MVTLRLQTIRDFGEIAYAMKPVAHVVGILKSQLQGVLPEVSMELAEVNETLEGMAIEVDEATDTSFDTTASSEEAHQILQEANAVAEQKMKERFPELPPIPAREAHM
jgi:division protein CdvB (Snf7/Vps24/ESCRT-III family)